MEIELITNDAVFDRGMAKARKLVDKLSASEVRSLGAVNTHEHRGIGGVLELFLIFSCQDRVRELDGLEPLV